MKFVEIYKSANVTEFYKVTRCFEAINFYYQILHEYRLHAETNFGAEREAIIRVLEKDVSRANQILDENGFSSIVDFNESMAVFQEKSLIDRELHQIELQNIKGSEILNVSYELINKVDFEYDSIHLVDSAIQIEFGSGAVLLWKFENEEIDFENDIYNPYRYELQFSKINTESPYESRIENVSENENWARFKGQRITDVKLLSQTFRKNRIITGCVIAVSYTHLTLPTIYSV